jgi:hypothetical protein
MSDPNRMDRPDNWQSLGSILAGMALPRPQASATLHALPPRRQPEAAPVRQPQAA